MILAVEDDGFEDIVNYDTADKNSIRVTSFAWHHGHHTIHIDNSNHTHKNYNLNVLNPFL